MEDRSNEYKAIVEKVKLGLAREEYDKIYLEMLDFINNDVNGEGKDMRYSHYYSIVWKCQSIEGRTAIPQNQKEKQKM